MCPTGNDFDISLEKPETALAAQQLRLLIVYLESDYAPTIQKVAKLISHRQIVYDLLWAIFLPGSTILATCPVTSERRAYRLREIRKIFSSPNYSFWRLTCEYVENYHTDYDEECFEWASHDMEIGEFEGKVVIDELSTYPIDWDPQPESVKDFLVSRGHKWVSIPQLHHAQYNGLGYYYFSSARYNVRCEGFYFIIIIIDVDCRCRAGL